MASPKPLSFQRVRLMIDAEPGQCRPRGVPRHPPAPRPALELAWRQAARQPPAPPAPQARPRPEGAGPAPAPADAAVRVDDDRRPAPPQASPTAPLADDGAPPNACPQEGGAGDPHDTGVPTAGAVRATVANRPAPPVPLAVPVAAIARAVEDATSLHALVDLVVETCGGEGKRETGPWEFTLPLHAQGLGETRLCLRLSQMQLDLRFLCDGPSARDLISRQSSTLREQLSVRLSPPLEVEITLDEV